MDNGGGGAGQPRTIAAVENSTNRTFSGNFSILGGNVSSSPSWIIAIGARYEKFIFLPSFEIGSVTILKKLLDGKCLLL